LLVALAASMWGLWPFWVRGAAGGGSTAAIALAVSGLAGLPFALRATRGRARPGRAWGLLVALGVFNAANSWLYFLALELPGVIAPAALSHYLAPVLVAVAAPFALGEPRSPRTPVALLLALAGAAVLKFGGGDGSASAADVTRALALGGASAVCYAIAVLIARRIAPHFIAIETFAYHALIGAALLLPLAGVPRDPGAWLRPVGAGLVSSLGAGTIYFAGLRRTTAERAAVMTYFELVGAIAVGWIVFGENPGLLGALGGALILASGVVVATARDPAASRALGGDR
jgi:drug/metabolite transporter (DMT)-like permease